MDNYEWIIPINSGEFKWMAIGKMKHAKDLLANSISFINNCQYFYATFLIDKLCEWLGIKLYSFAFLN
jgi:hypothetical protein